MWRVEPEALLLRAPCRLHTRGAVGHNILWPILSRRRLSPWRKNYGSSSIMEHVKYGRTGLRVSRLCLGTMTFGLQCDEATSHAIMDTAAAGGIDFIDTADVYPLGGG